MWWIATEHCWKRLCGDSFATSQAVSLFPQRLETAISGNAGNRSFCLLGPYPKPCEQPRCRGWLRVRFTNAVVPATQEQAGLSPLGEPEKRQTRPCWKKKNGAGLYLLPLPDCGKARKRLSGQFPNLVQAVL